LELKYPLEKIEETAQTLLNQIDSQRKICFIGEVGAGKTTMIKAMCQCLEVQDNVQSPTYALINEYIGRVNGHEESIFHMDLYRLKSIEEALDIGIEDYLANPNYCFIEWPEIIEPILPESTQKLFFELIDHSSRKVLIL